MNAQVNETQTQEIKVVDGVKIAVEITRTENKGNSYLVDLFGYVTRQHANLAQFEKFVKTVKKAHSDADLKVGQTLSNFFSRFRNAYKLGLVVSDYETQSALIKAITERQGALNAPSDGNKGEEGNPGGTAQPPEPETPKGLDVKPNEPDEIVMILGQIRDELQGLPPDIRDTIKKDLQRTLNKVRAAIATARAAGQAA